MRYTSAIPYLTIDSIKHNLRTPVLAAIFVFATAHQASAFFFQSFETDTAGWNGATRVMSGTHGVVSKVGAFHAEDTPGGAYTFWGGASQTFPPGGYTTSIDIYLQNC